MKADQEKWDARYLEGSGETNPAASVVTYWPLASVGSALDLACGRGRNSLFLAKKGFVVDAVDISRVAIDHLAGIHSNINTIHADLDVWPIPPNRYQLIVNIHFLDRRLFPMIVQGLRPGGLLIFESFLSVIGDRYCLQPGELRDAFSSLRIIHYQERKTKHSKRYDQLATLVGVNEPSSAEADDLSD